MTVLIVYHIYRR